MQKNIVWQPTQRQADFLSAPEDEVLFGGAAGGGKTDGLVVDALGAQNRAVEHSEYRALILRRTYPELKEVIDRTLALYPIIYPGARFNQQDGDWKFPSGARIEFSYLERDADVMRYQSRQYQWIGWEELAQWPSSYPYEYMISRLRAPQRLKLPCYIRSTCNPDGPGARWIAKRFGINPVGDSTRLELEVEGRIWTRRFIASRLDDNPHLADTGYREKLLMLPEEVRRALLEGRWDEPVIKNAIYVRELLRATDDGRIRQIPYDPMLPVHTVWDLGWNDAMSIIMFQKPTHNVLNIINYLEDNQRTYAEYVSDLEALHYVWGYDWLPHDAVNKDPKSGKSAVMVLKELGRKLPPGGPLGDMVIPRSDVEDGIRAARMLFPRIYIDNTERKRPTGYLGGSRLLECLRHYRRNVPRSTNEPSTPMHDEFSHAADAFRGLANVAHLVVNPNEVRLPPRVPAFQSSIPGMGMLG